MVPITPIGQLLGRLTQREREVLARVCAAVPYAEIGQELHIAEGSVKSHMGNIYVKLELDRLRRSERRKRLFQKICPALDEPLPPPPPEPRRPARVPRRVMRLVEEDKAALVPVQAHVVAVTPPRQQQRRRGCRGCGRLLLVLLVILGLLAAGFALRGFLPDWLREAADFLEGEGVADVTTLIPGLIPAPPASAPTTRPAATPRPTATPRPQPTATHRPQPTATTRPQPTATTRPWPTNTPLPPPIPNAQTIPTAAPAPPTAAPRPAPGGIGTGVADDELEVTLANVIFYPDSNTDVEYPAEFTLLFTNRTAQTMTVRLNLFDISGMDNMGTTYGQWYAVQDERCMNSGWGCTFGAPDPEHVENFLIEIQPSSTVYQMLELYVSDAPLNEICRVSFETDWIDVYVPVEYRTGAVHVLIGEWRLDR